MGRYWLAPEEVDENLSLGARENGQLTGQTIIVRVKFVIAGHNRGRVLGCTANLATKPEEPGFVPLDCEQPLFIRVYSLPGGEKAGRRY